MKTIIILTICLISLVSAQTIYSGETHYFDLTNQIENLQTVQCEIINNNSNLDGLNLTVSNTGYTISTLQNFKPDTFLVSCLLNGYKTVRSSSGSNSGGSNSCYTTWNCSEWSDCENNISNRDCQKTHKHCLPKLDKPLEIKSCIIINLENKTINLTTSFYDNTVVKEDNKGKILIGFIILLVIILIGLVAFKLIKSGQKKINENI